MKKPALVSDAPTERSPLLSPSPSTERGDTLDVRPRRPAWQTTRAVSLLLVLIVVLISLGDQLTTSPLSRILESVICYRHYERADPGKIRLGRDRVGPGAVGGVDEMWCKKSDAVQGELAMLHGWQLLLDGLPSLLLSIPYGWAADRFGRKPVLMMCLASGVVRMAWVQIVAWFWTAFDIRLTWLSTAFAVVGGGDGVLTSIFFVTVADITPDAERAAFFLRIGAFNLLASLVMPPLSAWLMEYNPWIPCLGGTALTLLGASLAIFLPETLGFQDPTAAPAPSPSASPPTQTDAAPPPPPNLAAVGQDAILPTSARTTLAKFREATAFLTADRRVPALMLPFLANKLLGANPQLILQYLSKRYSLTFARATLVLTVRNGVIVLLLFTLLPALSAAVMRSFRLSGQAKDLHLARASQILVAAGWSAVAFAPSIPLVTAGLALASLGHGNMLLLRSFLTSLVPPRHIARTYSLVGFVDTLGCMLGSPVLAGLFERGLALGGPMVGLPFAFFGLVSAASALLMFAVRLRPGEDKWSPEGSEEREEEREPLL